MEEDATGALWKRVLELVRVVENTFLIIRHWVLKRRKELYLVVIDEALQLTPLVCIGPFTFAKEALVLVGDHYQLLCVTCGQRQSV